MSNAIKEVNDLNFDAEVLQAGKPVLVDFWAEWCGPCRALTPIFEEVAQTHADQAIFAKVNVDNCPQTASKYGVMSIPTLIMFKNGEVEAVKMGLLSRSQLTAFVEGHL